MKMILNEISSKNSGIIHRRNLEEDVGISLDATSQSVTTADDRSFETLQQDVKDIHESHSSSSPRTQEIRQEKEDVREFGERVDELPESDRIKLESAREILDEQFSELERIEKEKYSTEAQIGKQLEILLSQVDGQAHD